jgi:transmembrane sensor
MENRLTYYTDLINKHVAGETSPEEAVILSGWIHSDPKNRAHFEEIAKTWGLIEKSRIDQEVDIDKEWSDFQAMKTEDRKLKIDKTQKQLPSIFHTPFSLNSPNLLSQRIVRIAALFLLLAIPLFFLFRYFNHAEMKELTAQDQIIVNNLPDGSAVTLNMGSTLEYPNKFIGKTRNVTLQGEAFFQVKHDDNKPFIISSGNVRIEVLGTTFYVNTTAGKDQIDVVLATGSVALFYIDDPEKKVILAPGERAAVSVVGNEISKYQNEDPNYLAWKTGTLIFNGDPLSKIIPVLNKVYHSEIRLTGTSVGGCLVSATFHEQSLESVLNVLKATLDLQIKQTGATIEISGDGCN